MSATQTSRWGALDDEAIAEARALMNVPLRRDRMQWVETATRDAVRQFAVRGQSDASDPTHVNELIQPAVSCNANPAR